MKKGKIVLSNEDGFDKRLDEAIRNWRRILRGTLAGYFCGKLLEFELEKIAARSVLVKFQDDLMRKMVEVSRKCPDVKNNRKTLGGNPVEITRIGIIAKDETGVSFLSLLLKRACRELKKDGQLSKKDPFYNLKEKIQNNFDRTGFFSETCVKIAEVDNGIEADICLSPTFETGLNCRPIPKRMTIFGEDQDSLVKKIGNFITLVAYDPVKSHPQIKNAAEAGT